MRTSKQQGFSLLELLLVLAAISGLLAVGVAVLQKPLNSFQAEQIAKRYTYGFRQIANDARRQSRQIFIDEQELAQGNLVWFVGTTELGREPLPKDAQLISVVKQLPSQSLYYTGRGLPFQSFSLTLKKASYTFKLVVLPSGLVLRQ